MINNKYKVYTDGGSRGNPGNSAIGFVVLHNDNEIFRYKKCIGIATNNIAEYTALIYALTYLKKTNIKGEITCFLDSELVVKQLLGIYKVKDDKILKLFTIVKNLQVELKSITFVNVPRAQNKIADKLVNLALDKDPNPPKLIPNF